MLQFVMSIGAIYAFIPIVIIIILIAAAVGLTRGTDIFQMFGIGTLVGIGGGVGSKSGVGKGLVKGATPSRSATSALSGNIKKGAGGVVGYAKKIPEAKAKADARTVVQQGVYERTVAEAIQNRNAGIPLTQLQSELLDHFNQSTGGKAVGGLASPIKAGAVTLVVPIIPGAPQKGAKNPAWYTARRKPMGAARIPAAAGSIVQSSLGPKSGGVIGAIAAGSSWAGDRIVTAVLGEKLKADVKNPEASFVVSRRITSDDILQIKPGETIDGFNIQQITDGYQALRKEVLAKNPGMTITEAESVLDQMLTAGAFGPLVGKGLASRLGSYRQGLANAQATRQAQATAQRNQSQVLAASRQNIYGSRTRAFSMPTPPKVGGGFLGALSPEARKQFNAIVRSELEDHVVMTTSPSTTKAPKGLVQRFVYRVAPKVTPFHTSTTYTVRQGFHSYALQHGAGTGATSGHQLYHQWAQRRYRKPSPPPIWTP